MKRYIAACGNSQTSEFREETVAKAKASAKRFYKDRCQDDNIQPYQKQGDEFVVIEEYKYQLKEWRKK